MITQILLGFISTIFFGIIDSTFFLIVDDEFVNKLIKYKIFDEYSASMFSGSISAAIAIFVSIYVKLYLEKNFKLISHPLLDAFGIVIGALLVIIVYNIIKQTK